MSAVSGRGCLCWAAASNAHLLCIARLALCMPGLFAFTAPLSCHPLAQPLNTAKYPWAERLQQTVLLHVCATSVYSNCGACRQDEGFPRWGSGHQGQKRQSENECMDGISQRRPVRPAASGPAVALSDNHSKARAVRYRSKPSPGPQKCMKGASSRCQSASNTACTCPAAMRSSEPSGAPAAPCSMRLTSAARSSGRA